MTDAVADSDVAVVAPAGRNRRLAATVVLAVMSLAWGWG